MKTFLRSALLAVVTLWIVGAGAGAAEIASHRASYVLSLGTARTNANITAIHGGMYIDWHEVCDGWIISQRMRFQIFDGDGEAIESEITFSSWEARDGLSYRFTMRTARNGEVTEELRGRAQLDGRDKGGKAKFSQPENLEFDLAPGTIFPTEHSILLIERALANERHFSRVVFDGATSDGALEISAVIGPRMAPEKSDQVKVAEIASRPWWNVRMAFFKPGDKNSEPEYETALRMLDNGVGLDFLFDYGDFSIRAKLDRLEALPKPGC